MTTLQLAQIQELEARLAGYRRLADVASTVEDKQRAISGCKALVEQITEIQKGA